MSFPKQVPVLSEEDKTIRDDFMKLWHEKLPGKYSVFERFNHEFPLKGAKPGEKILEIGAGLGEHLKYESDNWGEYYCLELRPNMANAIKQKCRRAEIIIGDCQQKTSFPDSYFDRILAIHVLEHLPNLPAALKEISRILKPDGFFNICIPCEGGFAYSLARTISTKRLFEKYYPGKNYNDIVIKTEHINMPSEIIQETERYFIIEEKRYFPLLIPITTINLVIGLSMVKKL